MYDDHLFPSLPPFTDCSFVHLSICRCVLDAMYDDHFRIKPAFLHNEAALKRRLR